MITATNHFTDGNVIVYDRSTFPKVNVNDYNLQTKSLSEIRKELKAMSKKPAKKRSKKATKNIVEKAISSNESSLSELDALKHFEDKGFEPIIGLDDPLIEPSVLDEPLIEPSVLDEPVIAKDLGEFQSTDVFNSIGTKSIDLVEFFRKVTTYDQMIACTDVLVKYDFYFGKGENNGDAMLSEIFSAIDRLSGDSAGLIKFACNHYDVYEKSLKDLVSLAVDNYSGEIKTVLEAFVKCMR